MPAETFAAYRALARALARLAPVYRRQAVAVAARALADGNIEEARELRPLLNDADLARASAAAARIRQDRDVATFDRAIMRGKAMIVRLVRLVRLVERLLGNPAKRQPPRQRPRLTNT